MQKTLKVFPNPWGVHPRAVRQTCAAHGLDKLGRPGHVVMTEVQPGERPLFAHVGAKLCPKRTRVNDGLSDNERRLRRSQSVTSDAPGLTQPTQDNCWVFCGVPADSLNFADQFAKAQPVEVPHTAYYVQCLRDGDLLPGDGAAAVVAGYRCRPENFRELAEAAKRFATPPENLVELDDPFADPEPRPTRASKSSAPSTTPAGAKGDG